MGNRKAAMRTAFFSSRWIFAILVASIVALAAGGFNGAWAGTNSSSTPPTSPPTAPPTAPSTAGTIPNIGAPGQPTDVIAAATYVSTTTVTVSWAAPGSDGGSAITSYLVRPIPQNSAAASSTISTPDGSTLTVTFTGDVLALGEIYRFDVIAINAVGDGAPSALSNFVIPAAPPFAPANETSTPGSKSLLVEWSAPLAVGGIPGDGGSQITSYRVTASPDGSAFDDDVSVPGSSKSVTLSGLVNGTEYIVGIRAINAVGEAGVNILKGTSTTPIAVPSKPLFIVPTPGGSQVSLEWTEPLEDGGNTITAYNIEIIPTGGGASIATTTATTSAIVGGLTNGTTYRARIAAVNSAGTGETGLSSKFVPGTVPAAPEIGVIRAGYERLLIEVSPPGDDGGSPLTNLRLVVLDGTSTTSDRLIAARSNVVQEGNLTNGTTYTIRLYAINDVGQSASTSTTSTPQATSPGKPTVVTPMPRATGQATTSIELLPASGGSFATTDTFVIRVVLANGKSTTTEFVVGTTSAVTVPIPLTIDGSTQVSGPATVEITALTGSVAARTLVGVIFIDAIPPVAPFVLSTPALTTNVFVNLTIFAEPYTTLSVTGGASDVSAVVFGFASVITVPLSEGLNSLSVTSKDFAGNTSVATAVSVTSDTITPDAPTLTNGATTTTAAAVRLTLGIGEGGILRIIGGTTVLTNAESSGGTIVIDVPLKIGTFVSPVDNDLQITLTDAAGNQSAPLLHTTVSKPDAGLEPPAIPYVSIPASPTSELTVILILRAEEAGLTYTVTNNAAASGSQNTSGTSSGFFDLLAVNLVADDTNDLEIIVTDAAGGGNSAVVYRTIEQDATPPSAPVLGIGSTSTRATYFPLPVTGDADNVITVAGGAFTVKVLATGASQNVPVPLFENVSHSLFVTQSDPAGNVSDPATLTLSRTETPTTIRGLVRASDLAGATVVATGQTSEFTGGIDPFSGRFSLLVTPRTATFTVMVLGISGGTRYYSAGEPGNVSLISASSSVMVPGKTGIFLRSMTAANLPTITAATDDVTDNSESGDVTITGTNLVDVSAVFLVPTDRTRGIRLGVLDESLGGTTLTAKIFPGLPAKTYNVIVVTQDGISAPSSDSITIDPQISPPIVRKLSQVSVAEGTGPTITLFGENLGGAASVEIVGNGSILTPLNVSGFGIDVIVPTTLDPGIYQFQVTDATSTGPLSPTFEVTEIIDPADIVEDEVVTDGLNLIAAATSPTRFILSSEGAEGDIGGVTAFVEIPEGVTFEPTEGQELPDEFLPPRETEQPDDLPAGDAKTVIIGDPNQRINLSVPVVLQLVTEGYATDVSSTRPYVYLETPGEISPRELVGLTATIDGVDYVSGGTILSETSIGGGRSEFTLGVLVDHFSEFTITSEESVAAPTSITANGGDTEVAVSWTAAAANDDTVLFYTLKLFRDDDSDGAASSDKLIGTATTSAASSTLTFTDDNTSLSLLNGFEYIVEIIATGAILGDGPSGFSNTTTTAAAAGVTISGAANAVTLEGATINTASFVSVAPTVVVGTCADAALGNFTLSVAVDTVDGSFTLPGVPAGIHTLCAFAPGFVAAEHTGVDTNSGDIAVGNAPVLVTGFVNSDTFINLTDILLTIGQFGTSGATRPDADGNFTDVNADTFVNLTDILRVIGNFGQSGYQTWN